MLQDYAIGRSTRRCRISDRPLAPGERYYSVIVPHGSEVARYEVAESAWQGPPPEAIGWWRGVVAPQQAMKTVPTPIDELLDTLSQLCEDPSQTQLTYLLGVMLLRRRVLQAEDQAEQTASEATHFKLIHPGSNTEYLVPSVELDPELLESLQSALHALMYREG
jgi:hypothetical protein